jgi:hypothetical protein
MLIEDGSEGVMRVRYGDVQVRTFVYVRVMVEGAVGWWCTLPLYLT